MTVSHANDSYFWVVTNFGDMTPDQGYKTQIMLTPVMGVASIIGIFLVSLFFKNSNRAEVGFFPPHL